MRPGAPPPATGRGRPAHRRTGARRGRLRVAHGLLGVLVLTGPALLAGCTTEAPPGDPALAGSPRAGEPTDPRDQLAGLAAAAQDRHLVANYTLSVPGQPDRTVTVTDAADRSWRVDIPGGALSGSADVSIARNAAGLFQCTLPSAGRPDPSVCIRVAAPGRELAAELDPRVQHAFTDWREVLTDRRAPLSVSASRLSGTRGSCFAVESTSASVSPPLDAGIYCYDRDGTLTAARLTSGTLVLASAPTAAPATIALPGPVVDGEPLTVAGSPSSGLTAPDGTAPTGGFAAPDGAD